ncbi:MAG: hypothetical protein IKL13_03045 [Clostridia bacterium]|nr:hypothetical protein [Clostridia bacterium]
MKKSTVRMILIITAIIVSVLVIWLVLRGGISIHNSVKLDMFASLLECQNIETQTADGATVTPINALTNDESVKDLQPLQSYGVTYESETMSFDLFAYVFATQEDAYAYFENATGKDNQPEVSFSTSTGLKQYRCIVMDHTKVFRVTCAKGDRDAVTAYINDCFSVDLIDINSNK